MESLIFFFFFFFNHLSAADPSLLKTLYLQKISPSETKIDLIVAGDRFRHRRHTNNNLVNFNLNNSANFYGLYYTRVRIGDPLKEFVVLVDTSTDVFEVNCEFCHGCFNESRLQEAPSHTYSPRKSKSSYEISCSHDLCPSRGAQCSRENTHCPYAYKILDGSSVSGYYVSDRLTFDLVVGNQTVADIIFGCSNDISRYADKRGILGFSQHGHSLMSQLSSRGLAPKVFSHCLNGKQNGRGVLVLGEFVNPDIVYTPLVPSKLHYNLNLEGIAVNGQTVPLSPSVLKTLTNGGTILDSGTTFAYLVEEVYDAFVSALTAAVPPSVSSFIEEGLLCYEVFDSVNDVLPHVTLNFAGGASMVLKPHNYFVARSSAFNMDSTANWCLGFQSGLITVLGELVLKDKMVVYDLAHHRVGWVDYNCSQSVDGSFVFSTASTNAAVYKLILIIIVVFIVEML